jgi:hypothetical protein
MDMKKLCCLAWIIMMCKMGNAQDSSINWGDEFYLRDFETGFTMIPTHDSTQIFGFTRRLFPMPFALVNTQARLIRHMKKYNQTVSVDVDLEDQEARVDFVTAVCLKTNFYIFYTKSYKSENKIVLYVDELDMVNLKVRKKEKPIQTSYSSGMGWLFSVQQNFIVSPDQSKLLLILSNGSKKGTGTFQLMQFDDGMNLLWSKEWPYFNESGIFHADATLLTNDGHFFMAGKRYKEGEQPGISNGQANFSNELISITPTGEIKSSIPLMLDQGIITDVRMKPMENSIYCYGFYSKRNIKNQKGIFILKFDTANMFEANKQRIEFEPTRVKEHLISQAKNKEIPGIQNDSSPELENFELKQLINWNGDLYVIGEQYYLEKSQIGRYHGTNNFYHFKDILVAQSGAIDGSPEMYFIKKNQVSENDAGEYCSYLLKKTENELLFFFNDNAKNLERGSSEMTQISSFGKVNFVVTSFNKRGELNKKPVFSAKNQKAFIEVLNSRISSGGEVDLYGKWKQSARIGFLKIH